ncbi:hypothetical protein BCR36DRAFT_581586 [Piromyces finnis]|uniref:CBM21 domain-containing protein n=1 Tax=Piromyces finnis TaxID=1754191 RepID=A0A1Y1VF28_9FUNG|nr:hypothetical protein BCR36DRAFT_581586 [Piromyces finnis]|eukprot:ORX54697.1 hypothetical protein BCR36DRAFT_581586 [Piromyces finnis]
MSVITNELSNSLESLLLNNKSDSVIKGNNMEQKQSNNNNNNNNNNGNYFILDHEPTGAVASSPRFPSNTNAVSIPNSKYRCNAKIRLGSTNSPSPSLISPSSATANGSLSHQSLKESLNKTISSLIENCQEKVILHNSSPSSSYLFTKHSTVIYSPSKTNNIPSTYAKSNLSKNNQLLIKKIKPTKSNNESKLSEITFGLQKKKQLGNSKKMNPKKSNINTDTIEKVENKQKEQNSKIDKKIEEQVLEVKKSDEKIDEKKEVLEIKKSEERTDEEKKQMLEIKKNEEKSDNKEEKEKAEAKPEIENEKPIPIDETNIEVSDTEKFLQKEKSLAKIESKSEKEILRKKKEKSHKKALSLPGILAPLTPLTEMNENNSPPEKVKRKKSVNFSTNSFKSICLFATTDKPESIKDAKVEVKIDDPESDLKDKEFSELRGYENAWSPVPRNVIHIQKFKSSKAKHVQYELPVSIQSFKLVKDDPEETDDKLTCLKVTLNVQNLNYEKKVVIRYTTNKWKSFNEVEAKYVKCIRESTKEDDDIKGVVGLDCFVARIKVGKYFVLEEKPGHICNQKPTKMLLVARYEVNNNTYWDNNDFTDYHIELVRINAGYDVPRVSKHGKPIPCPGCSIDAKQSNIIEKKGKEIKNNKRTVRKIGGVFGNFTEAVAKNNSPTDFMADKNKSSFYMGMNSNQNSSEDNTPKSETSITDKLTEEPQPVDGTEVKKPVSKNEKIKEKKRRPVSYTYGSSIVGENQNDSNKIGSISSSIYGGMSSSSKYDPPMSTSSSLYPGTSMSTNSSYNPSTYSYGMSTTSKYEPSPYNGGVSYDPSIYGGFPTSTSSKYDPPSDYSHSKYDPQNYYNSRSYSSPYPSQSSSSPYNIPSAYDHFGPSSSSNPVNTKYSQFSDYNFGTNLVRKANSTNESRSKYDVSFSTYSSFGDNFSSNYNLSPSAITY